MESDRFGMFVATGDGHAYVDLVTPDGVDRVAEFTPGEPCTCTCSSLLIDGELYGPGTWGEVYQAMLRLSRDADFAFGLTDVITEGRKVVAVKPLSDLVERFALPGGAIGDSD